MSDEDETENETEDTETSEDAQEDGKEAGGKNKLILIIAAVVIVIIAGVGGAFFMGAFDSLLGHGKPEVEEVVEIPPWPLVYHDFPLLVVDLKKTGSRIHYIKIKVVAEIVSRDLPLLQAAELKITDKIQSYLRSQSRKELSGRAGTERMRSDIDVIIKQVMAPVKVEGVLFREILLQ